MRKLFLLAPLIIFMLGASGIPADKATPARNTNNQTYSVEKALDDIKSAYEARSLPRMMSLLDNDYQGWLSFKASLEDYFLGVKELQVRFIKDAVLNGHSLMSVRLHWYKTVINNAGVFTKIEGSSQFVFKKTQGGLKLYYIRQDNPFF